MAIGKPYIATWSALDGSFRLYQMNVANVFVSVANSVIATNNAQMLRFGFYKDFLWNSYRPTNNTQHLFQTRRLVDLSVISTLDGPFGLGGSIESNNSEPVIPKRNPIIGYPLQPITLFINETTGALTTQAVNLNFSNGMYAYLTSKIFNSLDETLVVKIEDTVNPSTKAVRQVPEPVVPGSYGQQANFSFNLSGANIVLGTKVIGGGFSDDNRNFVCLHTSPGNANYLFAFNINQVAGVYTFVGNPAIAIPLTEGNATAFDIQGSGKFCAVGLTSSDGTTWKTYVYRKVGTSWIQHVVLNGIGANLSFTRDGRFLIDATTRKAYSVSDAGVFTENLTMMANISAGVTKQVISFHNDSFGIGEVYNVGLKALAEGSVDLTKLELRLITGAGRFNAEHTTLAQITNDGAFGVVGAELAQAFKLNNVVATQISANQVKLTCNDTKQIIIETDKTFRYAVVIDSSTGTPLTMIDFIDKVVAQKGTTLAINMSQNGLLTYTI